MMRTLHALSISSCSDQVQASALSADHLLELATRPNRDFDVGGLSGFKF